jgi:hypothetical protein
MGWRYATPKWVVDVLLRGNPKEIGYNDIRGVDADSGFSVSQLQALEEAGLKEPGQAMTLTQLAKAVMAGLLPPSTRIVQHPTEPLGYGKPGAWQMRIE